MGQVASEVADNREFRVAGNFLKEDGECNINSYVVLATFLVIFWFRRITTNHFSFSWYLSLVQRLFFASNITRRPDQL